MPLPLNSFSIWFKLLKCSCSYPLDNYEVALLHSHAYCNATRHKSSLLIHKTLENPEFNSIPTVEKALRHNIHLNRIHVFVLVTPHIKSSAIHYHYQLAAFIMVNPVISEIPSCSMTQTSDNFTGLCSSSK